MNPTLEEIQEQEASFDGSLSFEDFDDIKPIVTLEKAKLVHRMVLPTLVRRLYLFLFGEVDKEEADRMVALINESYLNSPSYIEDLFIKKVSSLEVLYRIGLARGLFEDQNLGEKAMVFLTTRDRIQELYQPPESEDQ